MRKFHQVGSGKGRRILFVGESPSPRGWHGGFACRNKQGGMLPSGKRLDELFAPFFGVSADKCGFAELCQKVLKDRKSIRAESQKGWETFLGYVAASRPELLILLGAETAKAFSALCGAQVRPGSISKVTLGKRKYAVLAIYHPSPRNPSGQVKNRKIVSMHKKEIEKLLVM